MRRSVALAVGLTLALGAAMVGCRPAATAAPTPAVAPAAVGPIRVAITVDDLPAHGPMPPFQTRLQIHERLLAAFAAHGVPRVYGFVNAGRADDTEGGRASLAAWVAAGHPLGNHTFSHPQMHDLPLSEYLADIDRNEAVLAEYVDDPAVFRTFRYPFLLEGTSPEVTAAVREHLHAHAYRVAEVTIDFYDWAFNPPYARCVAAGDDRAIAALRATFVEHGVNMLLWSDAAGRQIYGRPIPQVLLLHAGSFDAEMIDALLTAYERQGVEWITLDEALADPAYTDVPTEATITQGTLLDLMIEARGAVAPPRMGQPDALLDALCPSPK